MVGCIENFITGKQPPWSDGRFDFPKYFEFMFNHGKDIYIPEEEIVFGNASSVAEGLDQGDLSDVKTMDDFWDKYAEQIRFAVKKHVDFFHAQNTVTDIEDNTSPFLSIFCDDCIERATDINAGGAKYPSAYGAGLTGVATAIDSFAAIEKVIFVDKKATLQELIEAIKNNFKGYEDLRKLLLDAPKYGNNDDFVDKYADKLLRLATDEFDKYTTPDGGPIYTLMASNTENIPCGQRTSATPDGRLQGEPVSDAASPTYGRDVRGTTATVNSISKPDYTLSSGGSVINQKFSPAMFTDENRKKLASLIRVYFAKGGQEMQINATSREILKDAMVNPSKYPTMVVRVSGFSAIYITLDKAVQIDILNRTQKDI
jgi:formate C-acetyltransferase